ncbi:hypothetical protein D9613_011990 [Agrocybe pediades]|uniref:Uncharacterized protein n=1 Tax=Agrocybe pediades TaxID=84607 RepID=A0A8H4QFH0_9AGAR|nr:hypothetical protein D9613_011990 [Agrocybe pediades]
MADENGDFPKDVGSLQAFRSSTSMKRDLSVEVSTLPSSRIVQTFIDNTLQTAQTMLDNVNHHLQEYQDTFSVAEESRILERNDVLLVQNFTLMPPLLPTTQIQHNFLRPPHS